MTEPRATYDADTPAARDEMGKRIEVRDAALRRAMWLCEDYELTGIIDRVELQACLREIKAALKS